MSDAARSVAGTGFFSRSGGEVRLHYGTRHIWIRGSDTEGPPSARRIDTGAPEAVGESFAPYKGLCALDPAIAP